MTIYLLITAVIIIACIALNTISSRLGVPVLLSFILLGMFFGSDGIIKIDFSDFALAEQICTASLVFILFYGGFGTRWSAARPVAAQAILLSSLGVILTALIVGVFCHYILGFPFLESILIGAVISSTDAASVFSILRSKRLNLKNNTASMLEVESGSNDPCAYMLTIIILSIIKGTASQGQIFYLIFAQTVYGLLFGFGIAFVALWFLKRFRLPTGFDTIFVLAIAILSYAAPAALDGNGYLSTYITGIMIGNTKFDNKKSLVHFFSGLTVLLQMVIFFLLGLLSFPSKMPEIALSSIFIALFLTFVARPISVFAILTPFKSSINQQLLVSWTGLRGVASIVFAIVASTAAPELSFDLFHIVFCIVLFSILIQGALIPLFSKKLNMIDDKADVLKTFNDYTEETTVQFVQAFVTHGHSWIGKEIKNVTLPPDMLIVLIRRNGKLIIPRGNTTIEDSDTIALGAQTFNFGDDVNLTESNIKEGNNYIGKHLFELNLGSDRLLILIIRRNKIIIPRGSTIIEEGDSLVINDKSLNSAND